MFLVGVALPYTIAARRTQGQHEIATIVLMLWLVALSIYRRKFFLRI